MKELKVNFKVNKSVLEMEVLQQDESITDKGFLFNNGDLSLSSEIFPEMTGGKLFIQGSDSSAFKAKKDFNSVLGAENMRNRYEKLILDYNISKGIFKDCPLSKLKNGYIFELRNGSKGLYIKDAKNNYNNNIHYSKGQELILFKSSFMPLCEYDKDLKLKIGKKEYDIIAIYQPKGYGCLFFNVDEFIKKENLNLIWKEKEVKKVTMKEIREKFGCDVEII